MARFSTHHVLVASVALLVCASPSPSRAQAPPFILSCGTFGTGVGQFKAPVGVAVDALGDVYVADSENHRIQKFTSAGGFITTWGGTPIGDSAPGLFGSSSPAGVTVDAAGNVFASDNGNHRIQRFTSSGAFVSEW